MTLAVLSQMVVPLDAEDYKSAASCSSSHGTGFLPLHARVTCTTHAGMNGCTAFGRVSLDSQRQSLGGWTYAFMCDQDVSLGTIPIEEVDLDLSGIQFDTVPSGVPQNFKQVQARFEVVAYDPVTFVLDWQVLVNWMSSPSAMVDRFTADVYGEIVWSTGVHSHLVKNSGQCSQAGDRCGFTSPVTWPSGWTYGGTGFSGVVVESMSQEPLGIQPIDWSAEIFESVGSAKAKLATECSIKDGSASGPNVFCDFSELSIVGERTEVERATVGPFRHDSDPPVRVGFPFLPFTQAAMRCSLRQFALNSGSAVGPTSFIWFGANSIDCGWTFGDKYTGSGWHGWKAGTAVGEAVEYSLDATRLP